MSENTKREIMDFIKEHDVHFVRLAFCDIFGQLKNIAVSVSTLEYAFDEGVRFNASQIRGFLNVEESDLLLFPDPNTMTILPWRPAQGSVIRFYCDIKRTNGEYFEGDCRHLLKMREKELFKKGYDVYLGTELEFYLFKLDDDGNPTAIPMDTAGYFDTYPSDKGENIRREICLTMEEMGLKFESSHHEKGPGQNEVVFQHSLLLDATDNVITFKSLVKTLAAKNGLYASFLPKPLLGEAGSGFHINISIRKDEEPFTGMRDSAIAGILKHIREITVFLNPTMNSYDRLGSYDAPNTVSSGTGNRGLLVRVPMGEKADAERLEVRSADNASNPYIAALLLTNAAIEGVENGYRSADFQSEADLPLSLLEAVGEAENSEFVKKCLPEHLIRCFMKAKRQDWEVAMNSDNPTQTALAMEFPVT
jgi:Glutamine synthetase